VEKPATPFPWERLCLALLVALSLSLSGTYLYQLHSTGLVDMNFQTNLDSYTFHVRGISASQGDPTWLKEKQAVYSAIVGGLYALFGVNPLWVLILQVLLLASGCVVLYALGKKVFNPTTGLLAAGLWAVYPVSIYYSGFMLRAVLIAFLNLLLIYVLTLCLEKKHLGLYVLAAVISALTISGRYNNILFIAVFVLWFVLFHLGYWKKIRSLNPLFQVGMALLIPILGWLIWSQSHNVPHMVQWTSGNSYDSTGFYCKPTDGVIPILSVDFVLRQLYKGFLFFNTYEAPNNFHYELFREKLPLLRFLPLSFGLIFSLSVAGFVAAFRNKRPITHLALFVACYTLSVIPFFIASRHRLPFVPVLVLMAAYGIREIYTAIRSKRFTRLSILAACLVLALLFTTWTPDSMKRPQDEFIAIHRLQFGNIYLQHGKTRDAMEEYRRATEAYPGYFPGYYNLATMYDAQGDYVQAIELYSKTLSLNPEHAEAYFGLGKCLFIVKRTYEAREMLKKALTLKPEDPSFHGLFGTILMERKDYAGAVEAFQKTLALNPDFAQAHFSLGRIYLEQFQDRVRAAFHLRRFLQLSPDDPHRPAIEEVVRGLGE